MTNLVEGFALFFCDSRNRLVKYSVGINSKTVTNFELFLSNVVATGNVASIKIT